MQKRKQKKVDSVTSLSIVSKGSESKKVQILEAEDETQKKPKAKGPPPAAVPITKRQSGPPKPVIKKSAGNSHGAVMQQDMVP